MHWAVNYVPITVTLSVELSVQVQSSAALGGTISETFMLASHVTMCEPDGMEI